MERFYDGDQDQLFSEARVVNPFNKPTSNMAKVNGNYSQLKLCSHVPFLGSKEDR